MENLEIIQTTYQTLETTVANLAAAGNYPITGNLDDNYDVCDGIAFSDVGAGLGSDFKIEVANQLKKILDSVPADVIIVGKEDGTSPNDKFLKVNFSVKGGNRISALVITGAASTADTKVQITFRLRKTNKPVSIPG